MALLLFAWAFVVDQLLVVAFFFTTKCMCGDRFAGKASSKYSDSLSFTMLLEGLFHGNVVKIVVRYGF